MFGFGNFLKANRTLGELRLGKEALAKEKAEHEESLSILNGVRDDLRTVKSELYNYKKAIPDIMDLPLLGKIMELVVENDNYRGAVSLFGQLWRSYNK